MSWSWVVSLVSIALCAAAISDGSGGHRLHGGGLEVVVPETARGLPEAQIRLSVGDRTLAMQGVEFHLLGDRSIVGADYSEGPDGLVVTHRLSDESEIRATLVVTDAGVLTIHCEGMRDSAARAALGSLNEPLDLLLHDYGWIMRRPHGKWFRNRVMTSFIVMTLQDGTAVLEACDLSEGVEFDEERNLCRIRSLYRPPAATFRVVVSRDGIVDAVKRYREDVDGPAAPYARELAGKFLLDEWTGFPFGTVWETVKDMQYYGARDLAVLTHNWQRHGYDQKLPDVFPPNPKMGGPEALREQAQCLADAGIPYGLHENYSDIYPDAPSHDESKTALKPDEWMREGDDPHFTGWLNEATGVRAHRWNSPASLQGARKHSGEIAAALPLSASFYDVTSYSDPLPQRLPSGEYLDVAQNLESDRELYDVAREVFGGPAFGEGCMEKYLGAVDGANCDLWSVDRWGLDPKPEDWDYYPLFDLAFHGLCSFQGVGYNGRYDRPEQVWDWERMYSRGTMDDARSTSILFGHAAWYWLTGHPTTVDIGKIMREYHLGTAFSKAIAGERMEDVELLDGSLHRFRVTYANGVTVVVNRSDEPLQSGDYVLPGSGVHVIGPDFEQGTVEDQKGMCDFVTTPDALFLDARGVERTTRSPRPTWRRTPFFAPA